MTQKEKGLFTHDELVANHRAEAIAYLEATNEQLQARIVFLEAQCDALAGEITERGPTLNIVTLLIILLLILLVLGGLPHWGYSRNWGTGYWPSGLGGVLLIILIVLLLTGRL